MKKVILSTLILSTIFLFAINNSYAQKSKKSFKGIITYNITYKGDIDPATLAQQPKEVTIKILGNKQKMEIISGPAVITTIRDGDKKHSIVLVDIMGQKYAVKLEQKDIEEELEENPKPTINYLDETKTIAGYTCKKAEVITKEEDTEEESKLVVYYSEDIGVSADINYGSQFNGLKGFPLEYVTTSNDMEITFSAGKIEKKKIKDTEFLIPSDFKEVTQDELQEMFGGGE
jgi:GLPGLI family protein